MGKTLGQQPQSTQSEALRLVILVFQKASTE
jgi:hypothetical protein